jgi:hypothetical protein
MREIELEEGWLGKNLGEGVPHSLKEEAACLTRFRGCNDLLEIARIGFSVEVTFQELLVEVEADVAFRQLRGHSGCSSHECLGDVIQDNGKESFKR